MGWKIFTTFIKDSGQVEINEKLIESLGFRDFEKVGESEFNFGPKDGELYVSNYKGNLLIAHNNLNFEFAKEHQSKTEANFISKFPDSIIISISLGYILFYCVIEKGVKVRLRESGDEVYQDYGELLPEELYLKTQELIPAEDLEEMKEDLSEEEIEMEIQNTISYETVFELTKRIFEKRFDELELNEYKLSGFKFINKKIESESDYGKKAEMQFIQ